MPTTNALRLIHHFIELRIFSRSNTLQVKSLLPLKKTLPKTQWMGKLSAFVKATLQRQVLQGATNLNHARLGVQPRQPVHWGERRVERVFLLLGKVRSRSRDGLVGSFNRYHFLLGFSIMRFQSSRSPPPPINLIFIFFLLLACCRTRCLCLDVKHSVL